MHIFQNVIIREGKGKSTVLVRKQQKDLDGKLSTVGVAEWHARVPH